MSDIFYLSPLEIRILGTLIEKETISTLIYPISLHNLWLGCIQRTNRVPVMRHLLKSDILAGIENLNALDFVYKIYGQRSSIHYDHKTQKILKIPQQSVLIMAALMLNGPLRIGGLKNKLHSLGLTMKADVIETYLLDLNKRETPLVVKLPKLENEIDARWAHTLGGPMGDDGRPLPTREELIIEVINLRSKLEHLESKLDVNYDEKYDDTLNPR